MSAWLMLAVDQQFMLRQIVHGYRLAMRCEAGWRGGQKKK
jgi:hypothetical protein